MIVGCGGVYGGFAVRAGRERRERCDSDAERETFEELVEDHSYKKGCYMERKVSTLSSSTTKKTHTEFRSGHDCEGEADDERVDHNAQLQNLRICVGVNLTSTTREISVRVSR